MYVALSLFSRWRLQLKFTKILKSLTYIGLHLLALTGGKSILSTKANQTESNYITKKMFHFSNNKICLLVEKYKHGKKTVPFSHANRRSLMILQKDVSFSNTNI